MSQARANNNTETYTNTLEWSSVRVYAFECIVKEGMKECLYASVYVCVHV